MICSKKACDNQLEDVTKKHCAECREKERLRKRAQRDKARKVKREKNVSDAKEDAKPKSKRKKSKKMCVECEELVWKLTKDKQCAKCAELCTRCLKNPPTEDYWTCDDCRKSERERGRSRRDHRRKHELCLSCGESNDSDTRTCHTCKNKAKVYYQNSKRKQLWLKAKQMVMGARGRAIKKGLPCKITTWHVYDVLVEGKCEATGLPFECDLYKRGPWSPTIDRTVPQWGYVEDNIKVVVWGFNNLKQDWEEDTWRRLVRACKRPEQHSIGPRELVYDKRKLNGQYDTAKHRAKTKDIPFELTKQDYIDALNRGICVKTGIPFDISYILQPTFEYTKQRIVLSLDGDHQILHEKEEKQRSPWVMSVDQIIPGKGYTKDNTQFVVLAYNIAKSDFSAEDFDTLIAAL